MSNNSEDTKLKGIVGKKWFPAVVLAVVFVVVGGIIFFFPKGGSDDVNNATPETPSSSSSSDPSSDPNNTDDGSGSNGNPSNPSDGSSSSNPSDGGSNGGSDPSTGPSQDPEPDLKNAPPPEEGVGTTDKPAFVNGVPYSQTDEAIKAWAPVQSTFLKGLLGDGNILEKVKPVSSPAVQKKLEGVAPGAYKDELKLDGEHMYDEVATSFRLDQTYDTKSGKKVTITIEYVFDGTQPGKWMVTAYNIK